MNSHINNNNTSNNNSESDNITLKDILPIFLDDFIKDFSFQDICDYVNRDYLLFTEEEINRIKSSQDEKQQIITMFFILVDHNKNIEKFLDVLQYDFKWLKTKILQALNDKEVQQYLNVVQNLKSNFPKHSDFNVHRLKYFSLLREELKRLKPRHYLVIYGELGLGKKWLAIDACCDYGVVKAMGYNIIWLDVHNCDSQEKDIENLQRLKILLGESSFQKKVGDYEGLSNKILELQQDLRTILKQRQYKDCLLVLSNLQNVKTLQTFNLHCKILIITRNKAITEHLQLTLTKRIHISEGLTRYECIKLFENILECKSTKFPENYNDLFDQCNGHPFLLNIIAQNLKNQSHFEWNKWINNLENFQIGNNKLQNVIELSLKVLREDEVQLYKTLSIFNHSVKIPIKVLAALWDKSEKETEKILKKFDKFSLINIENKDGSKVCIIHFLYYSYLQDCKSVDKVELNKKLVKSFNVENALENRTELELIDIPNHSYFYHYIGYHLHESHMTEFFSKLYLDFAFLGQKLRITGLSNTIGDLKYFRRDITGGDMYKEELIDRLLEFLPNIEEMIYKSKDTCLLQYALMTGGILRREALKQAKKFSDRIWFFDNREHFRRRRQMIQLPDKPKIVKLLDPDTCLLVLDNHCIFLADLSLDYSIESTKFCGHQSNIINLQVFLKNYLITCDIKGEIRIWSISDERRRHSIYRRQSIKHVINYINYQSNPRYRIKECIQLFSSATSIITSSSSTSTFVRNNDPKYRIHNFYLEQYPNNLIFLYLIYGNGDIIIYKWYDNEKKFQLEKIPLLKTDIPNIRYLLKLFERYFLILNNSGSLKIFKLSDFSSVCFSFKWPQDTTNPINLHSFYYQSKFYIIFVFTHKILQLQLPAQQSFEFIKGDLYTMYEIKELKNSIKCSTISDDNKYLIIGTKYGLIVLDTLDRSELLRNNLSECIQCLDIYSLDDDIYKYIIVSGSDNKKLLNIYGLKLNGNESLIWANSIGTLCNEENYNSFHDYYNYDDGYQHFDNHQYKQQQQQQQQQQPQPLLQQPQLQLQSIKENQQIEVKQQRKEKPIPPPLVLQPPSPSTPTSSLSFHSSPNTQSPPSQTKSSMKSQSSPLKPQFEPNTWLLSGRNLFDVNFINDSTSLVAIDSKNRIHQLINNIWTMTLPGQLNSNITAISTFYDEYFIGCENGDVFHSSEMKLDTNLESSIVFLEFLNENLLIASSMKSTIVYHNKQVYNFDIIVDNCYEFNERYLILLNKHCTFLILDLLNNCSLISQYSDCNDFLGGSDLKSNTFVIATVRGEFYVYKLLIDENDLIVRKYHYHNRDKNDENNTKNQMIVTTIALSYDAGLCAVGFNNGCIEIYKLDKPWKYLQQLDSHLSPIYDLKFSPWTELNMPIILVSCAEQLCFWNITYVLNNPLDDLYGYRRRSSRFSSNSISSSNHHNHNTSTSSNISNNCNLHKMKSQSLSNLNSHNMISPSSTAASSPVPPLSPLSLTSSPISPFSRMIHSAVTATPTPTITAINSSSSSSTQQQNTKFNFNNVWLNKKGSSDKPELNACIKFIGNKSEKFYTNHQFTEFLTIDDEGEFYYLIVQNLNEIDKSNCYYFNNNNNNHCGGVDDGAQKNVINENGTMMMMKMMIIDNKENGANNDDAKIIDDDIHSNNNEINNKNELVIKNNGYLVNNNHNDDRNANDHHGNDDDDKNHNEIVNNLIKIDNTDNDNDLNNDSAIGDDDVLI